MSDGNESGSLLSGQPAEQEESNPNNQSIDNLTHACHCRFPGCGVPPCRKLKLVVQHARTCERRPLGCPLCKHLISMCCLHAKYCTAAPCPVVFCASIKTKVAEFRRLNLAAAAAQIQTSTSANTQDNNSQLPLELAPIPNSTDSGTAAARIARKRKAEEESPEERTKQLLGDPERGSCPICMANPRNIAFTCGHLCCESCSVPLTTCHMCRQMISQKIKLFF